MSLHLARYTPEQLEDAIEIIEAIVAELWIRYLNAIEFRREALERVQPTKDEPEICDDDIPF